MYYEQTSAPPGSSQAAKKTRYNTPLDTPKEHLSTYAQRLENMIRAIPENQRHRLEIEGRLGTLHKRRRRTSLNRESPKSSSKNSKRCSPNTNLPSSKNAWTSTLIPIEIKYECHWTPPRTRSYTVLSKTKIKSGY